MELGLRDQVFVVTGASRGLGLATARELVTDGARVVLAARDAGAVEAAAARLGAGAVAVAADLADPATPDRLVAAATEAYGRVDGALISVGGPPPGPALGLDDDQWRGAFDSIFLGPVRMCRAVVDALPPEGGSLALVLSSSVKGPVAGLAASNGLRPGLAMLAKTMADELGPQGVRVNGLLPGKVLTDRLRELGATDEDVPTEIPLRRYGDPAEFGRIAAFVLSPAASYLSGAMVPVDGGLARAL
jgi:3-oxoacyl-[acyl-carrier protein] reductase